jgi:predicted nucleic acid-binding protein
VIVLDASAVVEYLTEPASIGEWVRGIVEDQDELAAPHLIDVETLSAIRKKLLRKELTRSAAEAAVADFSDLSVTRYAITDFLLRLWELRRTLTPYDACYVALAEGLDVPLVTTDRRLGRSRGHGAEVLLFDA